VELRIRFGEAKGSKGTDEVPNKVSLGTKKKRVAYLESVLSERGPPRKQGASEQRSLKKKGGREEGGKSPCPEATCVHTWKRKTVGETNTGWGGIEFVSE